MDILERLIRGDETRKTRFHTSAGDLCLSPLQLAFAGVTTIARHSTGYLAPIPWIAWPAFRFLRRRDWREKSVFEYSSGMSTLWYGRHFSRVDAVENNPAWFDRISELVVDIPQVQVRLRQTKADYVNAIDEVSVESFDLISIDGSYRLACAQKALSRLAPGGYFLVDNTDAHPEISTFLKDHFASEHIHIFNGYPLSTFHPTQTTICVKAV